MDAGDVLHKAVVPISTTMTSGQLEEALCAAGVACLKQTLQQFEAGTIQCEPQDEAHVTFAPKITTQECEIDWNQPGQKIHNLVRGVAPHPGAWCWVSVRGEKKRFKVLSGRYESVPSIAAGTLSVILPGEVAIGCAEGAYILDRVQLEGKGAMTMAELLRGIPVDQIVFSNSLK